MTATKRAKLPRHRLLLDSGGCEGLGVVGEVFGERDLASYQRTSLPRVRETTDAAGGARRNHHHFPPPPSDAPALRPDRREQGVVAVDGPPRCATQINVPQFALVSGFRGSTFGQAP